MTNESEKMLKREYFVSPNVYIEKVGNEMVLMNQDSDCYFGLNAVGCRVVELLQISPMMESAVEALFAEYQISKSELIQDVQTLLDEMIKNGLVTTEADN